MKINMYPKLGHFCQYDPMEIFIFKKWDMGKSNILLLTDRDQSHLCRQRPDMKEKKLK